LKNHELLTLKRRGRVFQQPSEASDLLDRMTIADGGIQ